ncbi:amino acid permease [Sphingomonas glacialis]|uniref:Amino acid permease n=1 Tax=Sphingomonas glacialis TaxID=658225 RepID=A0A502G1C8_9SPHN|nr:amino acid permease [Sphingomonas glacialis]
MGFAASLALPSVILMMLYGQTRIFFVMARDGLLPDSLADVHPKWKTPHGMTIITGIFVAAAAALLPVGHFVDVSNPGTLFAFLLVAVSVMVLRIRDPHRHRPFRTPGVWPTPGYAYRAKKGYGPKHEHGRQAGEVGRRTGLTGRYARLSSSTGRVTQMRSLAALSLLLAIGRLFRQRPIW